MVKMLTVKAPGGRTKTAGGERFWMTRVASLLLVMILLNESQFVRKAWYGVLTVTSIWDFLTPSEKYLAFEANLVLNLVNIFLFLENFEEKNLYLRNRFNQNITIYPLWINFYNFLSFQESFSASIKKLNPENLCLLSKKFHKNHKKTRKNASENPIKLKNCNFDY